MNDTRNMLLAIVLSAFVLFGWSFISDRYFPTAAPPSTKVVDGQQQPVQQPSGTPTAAATGSGPAATAPAAARPQPAPRLRIETPRLRGSINLRGPRIDDLVLTTQTQTIDPNSPPVRLFAPEGSAHAYYGSFGWSGEAGLVPDANTVWQASGDRLAPGSPVTLSWDNGRGQTFQILLGVDEHYLFTVDQRILNRSPNAIAARPFSLVARSGQSPDPDSWTMHVGPVGVFNGGAEYGHNWSNVLEAGTVSQASQGGWLGFTDKYWLAAVIPSQNGNVETAFRKLGESGFQADFQAPNAVVPAGQQHSYRSHLFAGAKEVQLLDRYSAELGTPIERAIDWGWFRWFMIPIFSLLNWLFAMIGNFGVAIIGLTLIVRALLFPIAQKQFASMAAMRVVQPKMKLLQERYKDDKPRLQQEMLKLYKEEKVNPMAGCLPILLQIPIFYALYKVLMLAVEMRHEPFALWIQDLSAPDPMSPVNLFGYLPFTPPSILAIGVLPILLGITMWLQFKLNPAPMDPVQQKVFSFMPWVLMFVMAPFAAGLQLYWAVNNIISIAQQKLLYARHPALKQAPAASNAVVDATPADTTPTPPNKGGGKVRLKK